jgi:hypothetical protein
MRDCAALVQEILLCTAAVHPEAFVDTHKKRAQCEVTPCFCYLNILDLAPQARDLRMHR